MALKQHVSLFMTPFFIKKGHEKKFEISNDSIWSPCKMAFDKGKLYTHIGNILQPDNTGETGYHYRFFSLSEHANPIKEMLKKQMVIEVKKNEGYSRFIYFSFGQAEANKAEREENAAKQFDGRIELQETQESFFSPKLVFCPNAGIGILILSAQLDRLKANAINYTLNNLIDLNYAIFRTYPVGSSQTRSIRLRSQVDYENLKKQIQSEKDDKKKAGYEKQLEGIGYKLPDKIVSINLALEKDNIPNTDMGNWFWTMPELINRLMSEFDGAYERFDPYRLHVFTYFQVDEPDLSESLLDDYVRIMKLQNRNYNVLNSSKIDGIYERSFENIYMGSTIEGGAIMTLFSKSNEFSINRSTFILDFMQSSLSQSYLWTYVMILIQRYTLLYIEQQLTQHNYLKNSDVERKTLRDLIRNSTQNKVNSYFIDISDHTQHNQFYSLCCRNLKVIEYSNSVERKLELLTDYLKMLTEEENEAEARRRDNIGRWITVIGAVFALFSSSFDAFGLFGENYLGFINNETPLYQRVGVVLGSILGVAIFFWVLVRIYVGRKR